MSENIEKQVAEINDKLDSVSVTAEQLAEAKATVAELQETNQTLEAAMKTKDEEMAEKKKEKASELEAIAVKKDEEMAEMKKKAKVKAEEVEATMKEKDEELKKVKSELEEVTEALTAMKEEEMARKKEDQMAKRKANLVEAGLEDDAASAAVEKFDSLDDDSFEAILAAMTAVKPKQNDEDEAAMPPALKEAFEKKQKEEKEKASEAEELEEAESALEEVEAEETVDLSVGNDESETESAEASIRSELVEFVSARLGNTSK
jgi:myosin heavy subunit